MTPPKPKAGLHGTARPPKPGVRPLVRSRRSSTAADRRLEAEIQGLPLEDIADDDIDGTELDVYIRDGLESE